MVYRHFTDSTELGPPPFSFPETFDIKSPGEVVEKRVTINAGRLSDLLVEHDFPLKKDMPFLRNVANALSFFFSKVRQGNLDLIYGKELLRNICHSIFTADLRIILLAQSIPSSRILLVGDTGVGKETFAELIGKTLARLDGFDEERDEHGKGERYIPLNVAAFPETLLESELFGYEKGSHYRAEETRKGIFEAYSNGVIFLDEIGEAPLSTQVKLLRAIENSEIRRLGSTETIPVKFHLITATNKTVAELTDNKKFREDLF
jgi:transcriptional regulator with GAF, ATPase, and Fis domain